MSIARFSNIALILGIQLFGCLPALAADSEATMQKITCHRCLMKIYVAQHQNTEAQAEFQALLALTPNDARTHFDYASFLVQTGKVPQAVPQYKLATKLQPNIPEYQAALGALYLYTKNYDGAVAAYTKACQLGAQCQKQLQSALGYQAQAKQLNEYNQKIKESTQTHDEDE